MNISMPPSASTGSSGHSVVVSNDREFAVLLRGILQQEHNYQVELALSHQEARVILQRSQPGAVFIDLRKATTEEDPALLLNHLSEQWEGRLPVIAISDAGYDCDWAAVADLIISGYLHLPLDRKQLSHLIENELSQNLFEPELGPVLPQVVQSKSITFQTYTPAMFELLDNLVMMASHDVTILLVGETGTGKTTVARMLHELSARREARFLTVACGALPPELIESELFGHVRGAFTSAEQSKIGKFEAAQCGSLLLDEIDTLNPAQQAKLLRVIETGEFEPVGSNETRLCKARLIAASNVDLNELMQRDQFRPDLYYRLNVLEFRIPPLRERPRDIVPMALDFVESFCSTHDVNVRRVHPDFLTCLKNYCWPGNVRELKNHVRRAVLFCRSGELTPDDLAPHLVDVLQQQCRCGSELLAAAGTEDVTLIQKMASAEREMLEKALRDNNHNRTATARELGLSRVGLYKKMKRYGMIPPRKPGLKAS